MTIVIRANTTLFDPLPNEREPEEMNFSNPYGDKELRRTAPVETDQRTDWTADNNEKAHDSDVVNRYSSSSASSTPISVILFKINQLCESPTLSALRSVRQLVAHAHPAVKREAYEHTLTLLDSSQYAVQNIHIRRASVIDVAELAARTYVLKRIFV